jgi:hypothetical protein
MSVFAVQRRQVGVVTAVFNMRKFEDLICYLAVVLCNIYRLV